MVQITVGDRVWLADIHNPKREVGIGTVMSVGGHGSFHNMHIPPDYIRITLEAVTVNVPLLVPVTNAEQENIDDAKGSSVLWLKRLTYLRN